MEVKQQGGIANTNIPDKHPSVQVARRRRTALPEARRRRSLQGVRDEAVLIRKKNIERYTPIFRKKFETDLRAKYVKIKALAVNQTLAKEFNKDKVMAAE